MIGGLAARRRARRPGPARRRYSQLSLALSLLGLAAVLSSAWRIMDEHRRPPAAGVAAPAGRA